MAALSLTRILRSMVATVITLLGGVALVTLAGFLVVTQAPGGVRDLRAYEAAPRCPAAPSRPVDCRWTQEFTATGVRLTHSRSTSNRAFLTGADGVRWETHYSPVLNRLEDGDRVTGTVWRGLLTEISAWGESQQTQDAPADLRARVLILALVVVPGGLLLTAACGRRLVRRADPEPTRGMVAAMGLGFGLILGELCCLLLLGRRAENVWLATAAWFPMVAVLTAVARGYTVQKPQEPAQVSG